MAVDFNSLPQEKRLYSPSDERLLKLSVGRRLVVSLHGLPGGAKSTTEKDQMWCLYQLNDTNPPLVSITYPNGLTCVSVDADRYLSPEELSGDVEVTPERADEVYYLAQNWFGEVLRESDSIIFWPDAGDNDPARYANLSRAKQDYNCYIHVKFMRVDFNTAVLWNSGRLRKVSPDVMWRVYEKLEKAVEKLILYGDIDSWEIVDVAPVDFQAALQEMSLEELQKYFVELVESSLESVEDALQLRYALSAQMAWKNIKKVISWKNQILQAYKSREGFEQVKELVAKMEDAQQIAWRAWTELEKREPVRITMQLTDQAWESSAQVASKIRQLQEVISEEVSGFPQSISQVKMNNIETQQKIESLKSVITEIRKAAQQATESWDMAWTHYTKWEEGWENWKELYRGIPEEVDILGAGLESLQASIDFRDMGLDVPLKDLEASLDAQQKVLEAWRTDRIWRDPAWDEAVNSEYQALRTLNKKLSSRS
ncbi:hypothetical protein [Shimazuella alba]|uniref:Uncharacterized protein n=1 Tax=Shimazuella alba TaxID=2690964 RepID=A0A6I4VSH5_9BACL|nr:hypothetical protein [Shimazuella alba]MXQ53381.1 hypothetical protein [Shimazuella alba]